MLRRVCDELNRPDGSLSEYFSDVYPNLCIEDLKGSDMLFNPYKEKKKLLEDWLAYRGKAEISALSQPDLAKIAAIDMLDRKNVPSFQRFNTFKPKDTSTEFMAFWLSWFGISSVKEKNRKWWEALTLKTQKLNRSKKKKSNPIDFKDFGELMRVNRERKIAIEFLQCSAMFLALVKISEDRQAGIDRKKDKDYDRTEETNLRSRSKKSTKVLLKQTLAGLLGATAVVLPVIWDSRSGQVKFGKIPRGDKGGQGDQGDQGDQGGSGGQGGGSGDNIGAETVRELLERTKKKGPDIIGQIGINYAGKGIADLLELKNKKLPAKVATALKRDLEEATGLPRNVANVFVSQIANGEISGPLARDILLPVIFNRLKSMV